MALHFSSRTVPGDAQVKDSAGLLFGFTVTPFEEIVHLGPPLPPAPRASEVGRCASCGAYVNPFVKFACDRQRVPRSWACYVCGHENASVPARYRDVASGAAELAELKGVALDFEAGDEEGELVFLFVVDLAGAGEEFVERTKNCLMAALESIPRGSLVGLVAVSETLAVFDLGSKRASVKHIVVSETSSSRSDSLGMEEVLPLSRLLVPLDDEHEETILQAIEGLHRLVSPSGRRGFGTAVRTVVDYFAAYRDLKGARVGFFLGGRPNWGVGGLSSHRLMDIEPETSFYADEAALALSVTLDIFCVCTEGETLGLASLKFLPLRTGGVLLPNVQPQDLYRLYKTSSAVNCELSIRTSPDVAISADYQTSLTLSTCSVRDTFSYDLEFTSSSGTFAEYVVVQVAFGYSLVMNGKRKRFLRVMTGRAKTSLSWRMVYPSVLPEVQLTLLAHKIIRACFDESVEEARNMLRKWLLKLMHLCSENNVTLGVFANMKELPRFVFALLQSPILRSVVSADDWSIAQVMLSRLPPRDVQTLLYPALSSWTTPEKMQSKGIHLNLAACAATQCPLLLLDAYSVVVVKGNPVPSKESALRGAIEKLRAARVSGPEVMFDTTGTLFEKYMLEENGYKTFLDEMTAMEAAANKK